jgi:hypothetical protein
MVPKTTRFARYKLHAVSRNPACGAVFAAGVRYGETVSRWVAVAIYLDAPSPVGAHSSKGPRLCPCGASVTSGVQLLRSNLANRIFDHVRVRALGACHET